MGHGVAMVLVPAIHGSENRVFLWSRNNVSSPVSSLHGHQGPVVEVVWRKRGAGVAEKKGGREKKGGGGGGGR